MTTKTSQFQSWTVGQNLELEFDLTGQNTQEAKLEFDSELKLQFGKHCGNEAGECVYLH